MEDLLAEIRNLDPYEACLRGINFSKCKQSAWEKTTHQRLELSVNAVPGSGSNHLLYQTRDGFLVFEQEESKARFMMDPIDIVLSKKLIEGFDNEQAFYIGLFAGKRVMRIERLNRSDVS